MNNVHKKIKSVDYNETKTINPSFLFLVHTDIEFEAMFKALDYLVEYDHILKTVVEDQPYFIGRFGAQTIVLAKSSDMGSTKPFASLNTTTLAISVWQPNYVIMVGIMAGFKSKMKIGDVVVARESIDYQSNKIKDFEKIPRAFHYYSGSMYKLVDNITQAEFETLFTEQDYSDCTEIDEKGNRIPFAIWKGGVLSGDELVDSIIHKNTLLNMYPESIGLEMEFKGVASACASAGIVNILMVKGICDVGAKKDVPTKDRDQRKAVENAIRLCRSIFDDPLNFDKRKMKHSYSEIVNRSIFVSGSHNASFQGRGNDVNCDVAKTFAYDLATALQNQGYRLVTGCGREIGDAVIAGALSNINIHDASYMSLSENLLTLSFPRIDNVKYNGYDYSQFKHKYREIMLKEVRYVISIFGLKMKDGREVPADGVHEEVMMAYNLGRMVIPVGATGFMSKKMWEEIGRDLDSFYPISESHIPEKKEQSIKLRNECYKKLGAKTDFQDADQRKALIESILSFMKKPWDKL